MIKLNQVIKFDPLIQQLINWLLDELIEQVISRLDRVKELEMLLDKDVEDGLKVLPATLELLESAQTKYVD